MSRTSPTSPWQPRASIRATLSRTSPGPAAFTFEDLLRLIRHKVRAAGRSCCHAPSAVALLAAPAPVADPGRRPDHAPGDGGGPVGRRPGQQPATAGAAAIQRVAAQNRRRGWDGATCPRWGGGLSPLALPALDVRGPSSWHGVGDGWPAEAHLRSHARSDWYRQRSAVEGGFLCAVCSHGLIRRRSARFLAPRSSVSLGRRRARLTRAASCRPCGWSRVALGSSLAQVSSVSTQPGSDSTKEGLRRPAPWRITRTGG